VSFPSAYANPRAVGDVGEGRLRTINLVRRAGRPPTLYIARRQGPTVHERTDAPDQGARQGVDRVVGLGPVEINLTLACSSDYQLYIFGCLAASGDRTLLSVGL
jgi:hypothetical protein